MAEAFVIVYPSPQHFVARFSPWVFSLWAGQYWQMDYNVPIKWQVVPEPTGPWTKLGETTGVWNELADTPNAWQRISDTPL